jgi:hypothetical protein
MDPTPVIPPGAADVITPAMYGVLGWIAMQALAWAGKNGMPLLKEALGLVSQRDKDTAAAAKEGPIMVLERVERELKENKEALTSVLAELRDVRKQHFDCETKHAALQSEVTYLRREMAEMKSDSK